MNTPYQLPEDSIYCSNCRKTISKDARYCPHCGSYQNYRKQQKILEQARQKWEIIKRIIIFYTVYLVTIIPLFWLDDENVAQGMLIISWIDALVILSYWNISRTAILFLFRFNRDTLKYVMTAMGVLVPLLLVNFSYHHTITTFLEVQVVLVSDPFVKAGFGFGVIVFGICLMPAIWEEIAFRGLIQTSLSKRFGKWEAILITSAMFAIIHISAFSWPYLFLLGITLGLIRWHSQSLWPAMVMHFLHNLVVISYEHFDTLGV